MIWWSTGVATSHVAQMPHLARRASFPWVQVLAAEQFVLSLSVGMLDELLQIVRQ